MIHIAAPNQSSDAFFNQNAINKIIRPRKSQLPPQDCPVAFVGFNAWRRDEVGDANLFDEQVFAVRDGEVRFLNPHYELENFSPDGLSWGYRGSGPAQLAIAMLMEVMGDWKRVQPLWPAFQDEFVVKLPRDANWTADGGTVLAIALRLEKRSRRRRPQNQKQGIEP
jgi:hypothetical protein